MDVTREDVLRCAKLAHLHLQEEEIEPLRQAMERMLTQARKLDDLNLEGVAPFTSGLALLLREDEVRPSLSQAEALANAPAQVEGHFLVPKVL
ncbi:MAG TPA: Asp-tRNA(Asn)/Glu-tRNA(Gln) amidotransferase subunit GatC [Holophagaceae bacterium]|nr:Asp-tRNA(Asn)/Glu-tRNA(Gln) amidotransferase subunit GatC [Holophagaceae bacterium]